MNKTDEVIPKVKFRPHLDSDVIAWLKAKGPNYQVSVNDILRREMVAARK